MCAEVVQVFVSVLGRVYGTLSRAWEIVCVAALAMVLAMVFVSR
jgi:hypothetical protein